LTKSTNYLFRKRSVYYFTRRVPQDLQSYYKRDRIVISLRTKALYAAQAKATSLAAQLDEDWLTLRWRSSGNPFSGFLRDQATPLTTSSSAPLLSEAEALYVEMKGRGRSGSFEQTAKRSISYMLQLLGDKPVDAYTRAEVNRFRDSLDKRGLSTTSVRRIFSTVRAAVNFTARENGLEEPRAFAGVYLGDAVGSSRSNRNPIPLADIRRVQDFCRALDDEPRHLIALISDTGMRLSEAAGLINEDIALDGDFPHIVLRTHSWRRLKTKGSERVVPLVGAALWAARRAVSPNPTGFLFPKYCSSSGCKANSASAALNKWLAPRVPDGCVVHSFRHSLRDRLRAVECPSDIVDRLGGWSVSGIGESYGKGYPLPVTFKWMTRMAGIEGAADVS
ncbi:DUF6538 domain-containing protein, partial [uncultured Roseibium sp.]|uniref:DUF6538 domain-containing protein n=1 Tax=uncultured Roseibium sp. TaxID=1936171 RepID=UPI00259AB062